MRSILLPCLMVCLVGACGSPQHGPSLEPGANAAVALGVHPKGAIRLQVQRPIHDRNHGKITVDQRVAVSVLDPESATVLATARMNDLEALQFLESVHIDAMVPQEEDCSMVVEIASSAETPTWHIIPEGHWSWGGCDALGCCVMWLRDASQVTYAELRMNAASARSLVRHLDRAIRPAPAFGSARGVSSP